MMRAPLMRGKIGLLTVYDVFAVAPLGAGVVDATAGSALVTGYFTGQELKNILEFFLVENWPTLASISRVPPACASAMTSIA
jgi:5'-nucleotidase/UDP-sugar diphosphatase